MRVTDIAHAVDPRAELEVIGIRPGEKLHEQMIGTEDARTTYEYDSYFKILPAIDHRSNGNRIKAGRKVPETFVYASDTNTEWMTVEALCEWIATRRKQLMTR
jgi:FlaA1/EpsC-like NDP-sugar epimerase